MAVPGVQWPEILAAVLQQKQATAVPESKAVKYAVKAALALHGGAASKGALKAGLKAYLARQVARGGAIA